jgi:hypothetical protein
MVGRWGRLTDIGVERSTLQRPTVADATLRAI